MATRFKAVYCDGWDAGVVNPLTTAAAQARDAHGEPYTVSGRRKDIIEPRGDIGTMQKTTSEQPPPRLPVPAFGDWQDVLRLAGEASAEIVDAVRHPLPTRAEDNSPWRPPRPLQPVGIDQMFTPGTIGMVQDQQLRLSLHQAGPLRLGSGRLVAADP